MRKGIAILFLVVYAFGATDLHQVFKLPLLIVHYEKHRKLDPFLSVTGFLNSHYFRRHPFAKDYKEDMQLPFKAQKDYCMLPATVIPKSSVVIPVPLPRKEKVIYIPANENIIPLLITHSIFQPPRVPAFS